MLASQNTRYARANDVPADGPAQVLLIDALLALPQATILNGLHALAVDGPDFARLANLIDSVHVRIVERIENAPNTWRGSG